ncbi:MULTISPECIES: ScbA/BarX family gamma-butyrolactone biosynthesis protein [Streptomyces]|uniref:Gamma-butyrolactone biosynthesis enzyme n=2 Tax=Streptomyces TaxID=1883 RepID=A0A652LF63_9ACTN|nr:MULTISPECIES: ScbA/BarX family gamma-butyrolactone biosynthesis protein [unclassified Streptomyces]WSS62481.1 gamma-butyrolactone biosynthesis enzyme [Streptomyces sp. NBC_01177]WSS69504.1 gamma-butyrolactone biosynthesis enzyme [Streptomyces sp. NBC_01175]WSS76520.1 gamma-butyrolactone biosynthesis enzyme [Streptomyces sp. NBC_01174]MDX3329728.1 ScbA/BarX family gamma-butyrolactone biosynthesis protein [Streptomyces sp. ME02-6979-3A]MDX3433066.1 ScbA/BarX family gamma-butyrolactone biosynt
MPSLASAPYEPSRNIVLTPRPAPPIPELTTTVPRQYVHRASVSEVLLTGWEAVADSAAGGAESFVVRAQWPRGHSLFSQVAGYQDPMLLIESVRQIGSLLSHAEFGAPFGHQFLMWDMSFATTEEMLVAGPAPTEVELHTVCSDVVRRGRSLSSMRYDVTAVVDGVALATGRAGFSCTSPAVHRRLRGDRPTSTGYVPGRPIDPARVGRNGAGHVVLADDGTGAGAHRWELRVDTTHPIFFDHPVDHVPGMVLLEAARQAAHASTGLPDALVVALDSVFTRYVELDTPCLIEAAPGRPDASGNVRVTVQGIQEGRAVYSAELVLRPRDC